MTEKVNQSVNAVAVDLFCGAGGLTCGLIKAGIPVVAGYDLDETCKYPYEHNNAGAKLVPKDVSDLTGRAISRQYPKNSIRILVGCAPCTPFTKYTWGNEGKSGAKWDLLNEFSRIIRELRPDIVSMENVPQLQTHRVFKAFLKTLREEAFHFTKDKSKWVVYCPDYGMPQRRSRLVILASRLGDIELIEPTHSAMQFKTVRHAIAALPRLGAGKICPTDSLHRSASLTQTNLLRIRASKAGGCWRDWPPDLVAACHRKKNGKTYPSVYGRMSWDSPAPTITTQFYGFGNGRFGHPEQNRALSLREGAIIQTFPKSYQFVEVDDECSFKAVGRLIGNAVPVRLGTVIGRSINAHLASGGE
jgi:DNA (cytosine-5)-methyltransferase 1